MKGHVNSSGFPLQIAIKNRVNDTYNKHGWRTRYTEHSWRNRTTGESGFIDLVLASQNGTQFLVVECKRVKDTSWIFLVEGQDKKTRRHTKCFVLNKSGVDMKRFEWLDLTLEPSTPQSQFCVVPGTDNRSQSLIERASAELVSATEALALEDNSLTLNDRDDLKIYFNVIVTTAKLQVCRFDPAAISLVDGTIADAEFEEVPYVRFRKQLNPVYEIPEVYAVAGSIDVARVKENTVFVVNSEYISNFLEDFEIDDGHANSRYLR
ncbi:hypothetical protein [Rheinheimera nanhaiensis]|uniref:Uncharacterized protein n=1 Tax=Rheinheimera nanhaiensis E407-8 TaxID=562729 RepID=I1DTH0_9GAMM|nr:hypothetical protein [Rheinheimera nanhaiensis]GAB57348.1 hypothetical protein RNAN_0311 [Rheinheimera nanhaiensis E407-8]